MKSYVITAAIALAVGIALGRFVHPAPTAVHEVAAAQLEQHATSIEDLREERGEVTRTIVRYAPRTPGQAPVQLTRPTGLLPCDAAGEVAETITEHIAPSVVEHKVNSQSDSSERRTLDLVIDQRPRYSLLVGSRVLPSTQLELGAALRIAGPIWLQAELRPKLTDPLRSEVAVLARLDF